MMLRFLNGKQYIEIVLENSIAEDKVHISKWEDNEKNKHGYGLANVKKIVQRNNGTFEYCTKANKFVASITLKMGN